MLPSSFTSPSGCRASDADVETVVVTDVAVVSDAVLSVCSVDDDDDADSSAFVVVAVPVSEEAVVSPVTVCVVVAGAVSVTVIYGGMVMVSEPFVADAVVCAVVSVVTIVVAGGVVVMTVVVVVVGGVSVVYSRWNASAYFCTEVSSFPKPALFSTRIAFVGKYN